MITIVYESHSTSLDNEKKLASGHYDVKLSSKGVLQAKELGQRRAAEVFEAIFCSDLQRSYMTAEIAFGKKFPIFKDTRLRECDYGDLEHQPNSVIEAQRVKRINTPFPNGESYNDRVQMMKAFMQELANNYQDKKVLIIGHRATQYAIERLVSGRSMEDIIQSAWAWQPGWIYEYDRTIVE